MDKFLETYNLPKINQEEPENLNTQITSSETEAIMKKLPTNQSPGLDGFTEDFTKHLKKQEKSQINYLTLYLN